MAALVFPSKLFGRREVAAIVGLSDDLLGYWLTERLLLPSAIGESPARKHRRFDFRQLNLAALLKELHKFGVNVGGLRGFANTVQSSIRIGDEIGSRELNWSVSLAIELIDDFRQGYEVSVYSQKDRHLVNATSIEQIIFHAAEMFESEPDEIAKIAADRPRFDSDLLRIYRGLVSEENLVSRTGTGRGANWDESSWIAHPNSSGAWNISDPDIGRRTAAKNLIRSGIFLSISQIFRDMWTAAAAHV